VLVALAMVVACGGCKTARKKVAGPPVAQLPGEFRDVVAADLDGDGARGLFVLTRRTIQRATLDGGGWRLEPLYRSPFGDEWLGMSAGDVDGDGRDELVLWGMEPRARSVVLGLASGLADGALVREGPAITRVLRVVHTPDGVAVWGQRAGTAAPLEGPIHRYEWAGDRLERGEQLALDAPADVLDAFFAPTGDDPQALFAFDARGELERWVEHAPVWRDETIEMARPRTVERERANLLGERQTVLDAFGTDIARADADGDGVDEIWLATSDPVPVRVLERIRVFRGGQFVLLGATDRGLEARARSILLGRYATGVAPFDLDGDGTPEAVVAIVLVRAGGVSKGKSTLVVFDGQTADLTDIGRPVGGEVGGE